MANKFFPLREQDADPKPGSIASRALRFCSICDVRISTANGPGKGSICFECGTLIRHGKIKMDRSEVLAAFEELQS